MNSTITMPQTDLEDVACNLKATASLTNTLTSVYLRFSAESVKSPAAFDVLAGGNFNGGETGNAYEIIRTFSEIADIVRVIDQRIEAAIHDLEKIHNWQLDESARDEKARKEAKAAAPVFDNLKHADALLEATGMMSSVLMLADGLKYADGQMDGEQYNSAAAGAIRLTAQVMDKAFWIVSEAESTFRLSHGLSYGSKGGDSA